MPISGLDLYQPMIDIERSVGDTGIYAEKKPRWYIRLMNDMLVPVTAKQAENYGDAFRKQLSGKNVLVWSEDSNLVMPSNNGVYISTVSGITLDEYRIKYRYDITEASRRFVLPFDIMFEIDAGRKRSSQSIADINYLKLLLCAARSDTDQIILFGTFDLGSLKSGLAECLSEIADDIEAGKMLKERSYNGAMQQILSMYLRPDAQRANELRSLADRAGGFTLRDVWNELTEITMISIHMAKQDITEFDGVPLRRCLIATEYGIIGTASDNTGVYALERDSIFYEFLPAGAPAGTRPVLAESLRPGDRVKPVITTDAGLYRLPLTTTIEIVDVGREKILFRPSR